MQREELIEELGLGPVWKLRSTTGAVKKDQGEALRTAVLTPTSRATAGSDAGAAASAVSARPAESSTGSATTGLAGVEWPELLQKISTCAACGLCQQRKQAVPGVGDLRPDWLVIGEGPGAEEDERGEPFVGQAGKLLDSMLASIGLERGKKVYIANAVKCRPPANRTPTPEEMGACRPFLERQFELLQPRIILLLGRAAAHSILGSDASLTSLRGKVHRWRDTPVVATYHPAYLLRSLTEKAKAWEDLCLARRVLQEMESR
jgi:uracil-DNA glycosylase